MEKMYIPSVDERYMNEQQVHYFRNKLSLEKIDLTRKIETILNKIKNLKSFQADVLDNSNNTILLESEVASLNRYSEQVKQVEKALERIEDGSFGYCELTGKEIGLKRLQAMPVATLSVTVLKQIEAGGPSTGVPLLQSTL